MIHSFLKNKRSTKNINSKNLFRLTLVLPEDTSNSRSSSVEHEAIFKNSVINQIGRYSLHEETDQKILSSCSITVFKSTVSFHITLFFSIIY